MQSKSRPRSQQTARAAAQAQLAGERGEQPCGERAEPRRGAGEVLAHGRGKGQGSTHRHGHELASTGESTGLGPGGCAGVRGRVLIFNIKDLVQCHRTNNKYYLPAAESKAAKAWSK